MLDAWLKGKFYAKCKTAIKLTKTRVDLIRRKRSAMHKYFKNDIGEILKKDLDILAYERVEGLVVELNQSRCYDLLDQYCQQISSNLSAMNKQRECPEDCKEAVSTLMFAAARFADLPELRNLRTIFADRYGKSMDFFVNKEFVEKLKVVKPSKETKLQLIHDIASECSIEWNSKGLEQMLYKQATMEGNEDEAYKSESKLGDTSDLKKESSKIMGNSDNGESHNLGKESDVMVPLSYKSVPPPYTISQEPKKKETLDASGAGFEEAKPKPKSVRRVREAAPGEDGTLDTLLVHYSRKKSVSGEPDVESYEQDEASSSKIPKRRSIDFPSSRGETPKGGHLRAASYHAANAWNPKAHIHPKLPDYDDLIARLAEARSEQI